MGQVVHTLSEGLPVYGVTSLRGEMFLLRWKNERRDHVEVYDIINYCLLRCLTVPNLRGFADMTSCENYLCVYIADDIVECIHRLDSHGKAATRWPVNDKPWGLSVNRAHNLLVSCIDVRKIKEYSSHGDLLREITLPFGIIHPSHAVQLTSSQFVVCHGDLGDQVHGVSMITADGRQIVHSHGGLWGSGSGQCDGPCHLAVDQSDMVFVADLNNRRVKLLSPTLSYMRDVVTSDILKWCPDRLCLDRHSRRMYATENEWKDDKFTAGRVVVFSI